MKSALFTIALVIMMMGVISGQSLGVQSKSPIGSEKNIFTAMFAPGVSMTGVQNNAGTYDQINDKCWGNTFVIRGSGEWFTAQLTITMDYIQGLPNPDKGNPIVLGTWSMAVYKDSEYFATYYGDVTQGNISWYLNPKSGEFTKRNTEATLRVLGTIDGPMIPYTKMPLMRLNADTRLDGNIAFTNALMMLDL